MRGPASDIVDPQHSAVIPVTLECESSGPQQPRIRQPGVPGSSRRADLPGRPAGGHAGRSDAVRHGTARRHGCRSPGSPGRHVRRAARRRHRDRPHDGRGHGLEDRRPVRDPPRDRGRRVGVDDVAGHRAEPQPDAHADNRRCARRLRPRPRRDLHVAQEGAPGTDLRLRGLRGPLRRRHLGVLRFHLARHRHPSDAGNSRRGRRDPGAVRQRQDPRLQEGDQGLHDRDGRLPGVLAHQRRPDVLQRAGRRRRLRPAQHRVHGHPAGAHHRRARGDHGRVLAGAGLRPDPAGRAQRRSPPVRAGSAPSASWSRSSGCTSRSCGSSRSCAARTSSITHEGAARQGGPFCRSGRRKSVAAPSAVGDSGLRHGRFRLSSTL